MHCVAVRLREQKARRQRSALPADGMRPASPSQRLPVGTLADCHRMFSADDRRALTLLLNFVYLPLSHFGLEGAVELIEAAPEVPQA